MKTGLPQGSEKRFDVTAVGSTMIKLSVPAGTRLETAHSLELGIGGTESNTLIAMSRLGRRTAWVSRLVDNPLGRRIRNDIRAHGVDVSGIVWTTEGRNELYFVEYASAPRPIRVLYDRENAAVASISANDIDASFLMDSRIIHFTGIFAALSESCRAVIHRLLSEFRKEDAAVSFDVNYREKLWSPASARKHLEPILEVADIVVMTIDDARRVLDIHGGAEETLDALNRRFGEKTYALTLGDRGAVARSGGTVLRATGYPVAVIDRIGAGDSFCAGFLHGVLDGDLQKGLDFGTAMAALNLGIKGDLFVSGEDEVRQLIRHRDAGEVIR